MLASFNGFHRGESMMVIGSSNHHRVDLLHFIQHLTIIRELLCLWVFIENMGGMMFIHITKGDNVLTFHLSQVVAALTSEPNACDVELAAWGSGAIQSQHGTRDEHKASG